MAICNLIIGAIVYTFRDTAGPILEQLKETTPSVLAGICVMSGIYCLVEALITTVLAKQYNPDFRYQWGIENMFSVPLSCCDTWKRLRCCSDHLSE